jgi:hypothetical protein
VTTAPAGARTITAVTEPMTAAVPTHDRFERPALFWYALLDSGIASLAVLASSQGAYDTVSSRLPVPPRSLLQAAVVGTVLVHVGEATFAYRTAKAAGMDRSAGRWAREALLVGFPSLLLLRKIAAEQR